MPKHAIVLGAREGSGNIGEAVCNVINMETSSWLAEPEDCSMGGGVFLVPPARDLGPFDALVVSLGRSLIEPITGTDEPDLEDVIHANLIMPMIAAARYVGWRQSAGEPGGTVIFIGSYAHDHVLSNSAAYCAAKAGLNHLARCLAWDHGAEVAFHVVNPYHVEGTPMEEYVIDAIRKTKLLSEDEARAYQRKDLRRAALGAEDVARVVVRLLTDDVWADTNGQSIDMYAGVR